MENEELEKITPGTPEQPETNFFHPPESFNTPIAETPNVPAPSASEVEPAIIPPVIEEPAYETKPLVTEKQCSIPPVTPPMYRPSQPFAPPVQTAPQPQRYTPQIPPKKKNKSVGILGIIAVGLCCSLVGGLLGAFLYGFLQPDPAPVSTIDNSVTKTQTDNSNSTDTQKPSSGSNITPGTTTVLDGQREPTKIETESVDTSEVYTAAEVYEKYVNSTVGITTSITTNYWGFQSTSAASGSGFIISEDGYILTNFHVIENSSSITVTTFDDSEYKAELIGYDVSNDLAVLKIDAKDLQPVVLGNSDNMRVGDPVIAIGNPLGELTFSLTAGTVSAIGRTVTMSNGTTMKLIQTDCAINSGNSGGALFNLHGEVIGITNAKYSGNSGSGASIDNIGFAIPINIIKPLKDDIIEKGYVSKPYIGVTVSDITEELQSYGIPIGASVRSITEKSPAEECGLKVGDIITSVNDTQITGSSDLVDYIGNCNIGDVLKLIVYRRGETLELTSTVGEQTQNARTN